MIDKPASIVFTADGSTWVTVFDSATQGEYAETLAGKTHTFTQQNVRYVRDYLNGSTANSENHWTEIEVWGATSTAYVGDCFEWNGSLQTMTRYYYAGGQRVAVRNGNGSGTNGLVYLLSDHFGSTNLTADPLDGDRLSELRYKAWGETRYALTSLPTDRRYTGQIEEAGIGLYFFNARWYDIYLNRWIQPDSIIPDPNNPQSFDRYAYSYGNPVKYIDPDGHCPRPASGSGNVICVDLFIQSKKIVFGLGRGDNRGFDTNSAPEASRAYAYIYLDDSGNVIGSEVSINQSCTVVGCFGPADEFNDFSVSQESTGGDINITWNLLNGVSGELREHANEAYEEESSIGAMPLYSNIVLAGSYGLASINGEMTLSLGDGGNYQITSLDRDPYPSLEVYSYKNGDYQYTLGQFKERYGPFIGLSPIAPNQRITAR